MTSALEPLYLVQLRITRDLRNHMTYGDVSIAVRYFTWDTHKLFSAHLLMLSLLSRSLEDSGVFALPRRHLSWNCLNCLCFEGVGIDGSQITRGAKQSPRAKQAEINHWDCDCHSAQNVLWNSSLHCTVTLTVELDISWSKYCGQDAWSMATVHDSSTRCHRSERLRVRGAKTPIARIEFKETLLADEPLAIVRQLVEFIGKFIHFIVERIQFCLLICQCLLFLRPRQIFDFEFRIPCRYLFFFQEHHCWVYLAPRSNKKTQTTLNSDALDLVLLLRNGQPTQAFKSNGSDSTSIQVCSSYRRSIC